MKNFFALFISLSIVAAFAAVTLYGIFRGGQVFSELTKEIPILYCGKETCAG